MTENRFYIGFQFDSKIFGQLRQKENYIGEIVSLVKNLKHTFTEVKLFAEKNFPFELK